jgi:probable F420-dependent oxidoreductase
MATKVYTGMGVRLPLGEVPEYVRRVEAVGYDGIVIPEAVHDGFLVCLSALEHSQSLVVTAGVILAFPRSPMVVAHAAWDLQSFSGGRFELGLGSQVKGNVVGRFSVPWTHPIPRMREYVQSLRAIWDCWQKGSPLDFRGKHYSFTRMQPYFNPGPIEHPHIPLFLGAVNPAMTRLAGEVCDGMISHPTSSDPRYIREVTVPNLEAGARRAGRSMQGVSLAAGGFVITGQNRREVAKAREDVRELMAFLYSTPAYWPTLELHGWGDVGRRLRQMTREGGWREMAREITDEIVDQLAATGTYDEIADKLKERHRGLATRISFPMPADTSLDRQVARVVAALKR